jgi:hypothetical protein
VLHGFSFLLNIIRMIKSRMLRQTGGACETHREEKRNSYSLLAGKPEGKRPPQDLSSNRIILQWLVNKYHGWV